MSRRGQRLSPVLRLVAASMVLIALPGAQEALEDAVHLIADGHTAHDPGHGAEQPEHCCSGLFHSCACHANAVAVPATSSDLPRPDGACRLRLVDDAAVLLPGFHTPPFRPPTAQL